MRPLEGRVLALSPHLDDVVWSIGGSLANAVQQGAEVTVVTVLAGEPASCVPAGRWDRQCGFRTAGEAARVRGAEDEQACAVLGARAVHLPFGDETYARGGTDDEVWARLETLVRSSDIVLVPGFPLTHGDHVWLAALALDRTPAAQVVVYAEQPYAMWRLHAGERLGTPVCVAHALVGRLRWTRVRPPRAARSARARAARAYRSQLRAPRTPYRLLPSRLAFHELAQGGEALGTVEAAR